MELLNFIQSDFCKEVLESSDLKIRIETGNIYYKNTDTNESIFEFFKNHQNSSNGEIKFGFIYDGNYNEYYRWILRGFDGYKKTKFYVLTYKSTKFLRYQLNDLLNQSGKPIRWWGRIFHQNVTIDLRIEKKFSS